MTWKHFLQWIETAEDAVKVAISDAIRNIEDFSDNISEGQMLNLLDSDSTRILLHHFEKFLQFLRSSNGNLSAFWMSYIDMVNIMFNLIRGSREGNWKLHLTAIQSLVAWCFSYDNLNYARYLSIYFAQMSRLELEHPDVFKEFVRGSFSVQLSDTNTFSRIPVDQTIEETINKDTKTPGGIKGFSVNYGAVKRHYLTADTRSSCLNQLRLLSKMSTACISHPDLTRSRISKDEADVKEITEILTSSWIDPFDGTKTELVNIASGVLATEKISNDLLAAEELGEKAYQKFKRERLEVEHGTTGHVKFHNPLNRLNLKTFSDVAKKTEVKGNHKNIMIMNDKYLFGRMVLIGQSRNLQMKDVLSHPLGPIPYELASVDGSIRKNCKSSLGKELLKNSAPVTVITQPKACILDGMSFVHRLSPTMSTFSAAAESLLRMILRDSGDCQRIDVVFDVYREVSIKGGERHRRSESNVTRFTSIQGGHKIKQWSKFLSNSQNKQQFIAFLNTEWKDAKYTEKLRSKELFLTDATNCLKFSHHSVEAVEELSCDQEEADTRMLLHAQHAYRSGYNNVIVVSEDTDVLVLLISFCTEIGANLFMQSGSTKRHRIININSLSTKLGPSICKALPGIHAFTGCDTVSAFAGRGKVNPWKLMQRYASFTEIFGKLGIHWTASEEVLKELEVFTCQLYGSIGGVTDINDCRYRLFCSKKGEIESYQLPPCRDCLHKHTERANYQSAIWRRALIANPSIPSPHGHGWIISGVDGSHDVKVEWMSGLPAPMAVLELLSCQCKKQCSQESCPCIISGLQCTEMCRLTNCTNRKTEEEEESISVDHVLDAYSDDEDDSLEENETNAVYPEEQAIVQTLSGEEQIIDSELSFVEVEVETSVFEPMDE